MQFNFLDMVMNGWMLYEYKEGKYKTIRVRSEATN